MNISIDWGGCYLEHRQYFDAMANAMIAAGHKVGIITGEREHKRQEILGSLGFTPSFVHCFAEEQAIPNVAKWKVERMLEYDILLHFDDEAPEMKMWTQRWVVKVMNSAHPDTF